MSSILPIASSLEQIPQLHYKYADHLLSILISTLLKQERIPIGICDGKYSAVAINSDDGENVTLELRCNIKQQFTLKLIDDSEGNFTSVFTYKRIDQLSMFEIVPGKLQSLMIDAIIDNESQTISTSQLR